MTSHRCILFVVASYVFLASSFSVECWSAAIRPVAHFGFDEPDKADMSTAINSVGLDGEYRGRFDQFVAMRDIENGVFGRAINFGTSRGHVSLPQAGIGGEIDSLETFTVMAWVGWGQASILGQFGESWEGLHILTRNHYLPSSTLDSIAFYTGFATGATKVFFSRTPILDSSPGYQHVAVTYSSEFARLYLDAELIAEAKVDRSIVPSGQDYFIGGEVGVHSGGITAFGLDELWIYEGVLSQQQIERVYETNTLVPELATITTASIGLIAIGLSRTNKPTNGRA